MQTNKLKFTPRPLNTYLVWQHFQLGLLSRNLRPFHKTEPSVLYYLWNLLWQHYTSAWWTRQRYLDGVQRRPDGLAHRTFIFADHWFAQSSIRNRVFPLQLPVALETPLPVALGAPYVSLHILSKDSKLSDRGWRKEDHVWILSYKRLFIGLVLPVCRAKYDNVVKFVSEDRR
jgi:uncharacterized membrane protein